MLNMAEELRNFQPIDITAIEEAGLTMSNEERSSYELYNRALDNLRIGSEDIAVIELKKAISINKKFHKAMNLLGLCYYIVKEYSLSEKIFKAVMEAENEGIAAERYLCMMHETENESDAAKTKPAPPAFDLRGKCEKLFAAISGIFNSIRKSKTAMVIVSGVLLAVITVSAAVLVASSMKSSTVNAPPGYISDREAEELRSRIAQLTNELENLKKNEKTQEGQEQAVILPSILEAERLYMAGSVENAADKLTLLRGTAMNAVSKEKYDKLVKEVLTKAGEKLYVDGYGLLMNQKYSESIQKLKKVIIYGMPADVMDDTYYFLGMAYKDSGDYINAYNTFKKITESFSDSEYANKAKDRMSELSSSQP